MFGNKFAAEELAKNYKQEVSKLQALKKKAQLQEEPPAQQGVNPEDFLVAPTEQVDVHGDDLNNRIQQVENYAKDIPCEKCDKIHEGETCSEPKESDAEDMSYLVDKKAQFVLFQLGKIAKDLRTKQKGFAADMVETTALEIKASTIKRATQKLQIISGLSKMASESYKFGDQLTGDVISVTIENIKKSN